MKKITYLIIIIALSSECVFAQNYTGLGTLNPITRLDVNGALTIREGIAVIASGTTAIIPDALISSQYRIDGTPTGNFIITPPSKASDGITTLRYGARMVIVNNTKFTATLNGFSIGSNSVTEFIYGFTAGDRWLASNNSFPQMMSFTSNAQQDLLKNANIGQEESLKFKLETNLIIDASFNATANKITLPAGTYSCMISLDFNPRQVSTFNVCPTVGFWRPSYFIDFPTGSDDKPGADIRIHSNSLCNCGNQSSHSASWVTTFVITGTRTWDLQLGRGQAGNMAGTNTFVDLTLNSRILIQKLL